MGNSDDASALIWTAEDLIRVSKHDDADVRAWAVRRLCLVDPETAAATATGLLEDPEPSVQSQALGALAHPNAAQVEALIDHLDARKRPRWVTIATAEALARSGDPRALDRLARMCRETTEERISVSLWRCRAVADPETVRSELLRRTADWGGAPMIDVLLRVALPQDARTLVDRILAVEDGNDREQLLLSLARLCGVGDDDFDGEELESFAVPEGESTELIWARSVLPCLAGRQGRVASAIQRACERERRLPRSRVREDTRSLSEILKALRDDDPPEAWVEASRLAAARPEELRESAPAFLNAKDRRRASLVVAALGVQTRRWATDLVMARLDDLLRGPDSDSVWECLVELGDPRAVGMLAAEWREGEWGSALAVDFIARVAGTQASVSPEIRREAELARRRDRENRERGARAKSVADLWDLLPSKPLDLHLICNACGRTFTYPVDEVWMHPDREKVEGWDGVVLSRIITCKKCGAEDDYTQAPRTQYVLMGGMLRLLASGKKDTEDSPLKVGIQQLWDGTEIRRPTQALNHLRGACEQRPDDPAMHVRLGNLNRRYGRIEEADRAYRRAVELNPRHTEALYNLLMLCLERQHPETPAFLQRVLKALPDCDPKLRPDLTRSVVEILEDFAATYPEPLMLQVGWLSGKERIANLSGADLKRLRRWKALAEFLADDRVRAVELTQEAPGEHPTILEEVLASWGEPSGARAAEKVGRNASCPCGSGKKHKKCCLGKASE